MFFGTVLDIANSRCLKMYTCKLRNVRLIGKVWFSSRIFNFLKSSGSTHCIKRRRIKYTLEPKGVDLVLSAGP